MRRWPVIGAVAGALSLALLGDQMLYVVLPGRPEAAGVGIAALGIILGANRFIRLGANSLAGLASDRLGRRPLFLTGMALALVSTAGYLLTSGFWPLVAARLVWGLAYAALAVGGSSIALDLATPADRARTVGVYLAFVQGGTLAGLVLSGILADALGYRGTLMLYVPLTALGGLLALALVRETAPGRATAPTALDAPVGVLRALDRRLAAPAAVSFASNFAGSGVLMATLGMYLRQVEAAVGLALPVATLTGLLLASRRLAGMLAAPLAGQLSDRIGNRRPVALAGALTFLAGFAVLVAAPPALATVITGVALIALGEAMLDPSLAAWAGDTAAPDRRGITMGAMATARDLGAALGPVVAYPLAAAVSLDAAYVLSLALAATTVALLAASRRRRAPRPGPPGGDIE